MPLFKCNNCGKFFGCRSSHYCKDLEFVLITPGSEPEAWSEYIDWNTIFNDNLKTKNHDTIQP